MFVDLGNLDDTLTINQALDFTVNPSGNDMRLLFVGGTGTNTFNYDNSVGIISSKNNLFEIYNFDTFNNTFIGNATIQASGGNIIIDNPAGPITLSPGSGTTLQASTGISIRNEMILNASLTIQNVAVTDGIPITASTATGNSFTGNSSLTIRTAVNIDIGGIVAIGLGAFTVNNATNFKANSDDNSGKPKKVDF